MEKYAGIITWRAAIFIYSLYYWIKRRILNSMEKIN